jgi:hypothetical protein
MELGGAKRTVTLVRKLNRDVDIEVLPTKGNYSRFEKSLTGEEIICCE